jgi:hypothetical protein
LATKLSSGIRSVRNAAEVLQALTAFGARAR